MTKRNYIRLFSFAFAVLAVLGTFGIVSAVNAENYKARLESNYRQSLSELSECLDLIETNLTKSIYANSDVTLSNVSRDLFAESNEAKDALSRLPVNQMNLSGTYKFLSQASDYASYLNAKLEGGEKISEAEHQNLTKLLSYSSKYKKSINLLVDICNSGAKITEQDVKSSESQTAALALDNDFSTAEEAFDSFPTLLYDGPFADAVLNKESKLLKQGKEISREDAKAIAAKALGCSKSEVMPGNDEEGKLPSYVFTRNQQTIAISKNGGYVVYILFGGKITAKTIDEKNAVNLASDFLDKIGYTDMKNSYFAVSNNICTINFAYCKNDVMCYTDLIKVGISMNDGSVISLEAKGYLTNHEKRDTNVFEIDESKAKSAVSTYLSITSSQKCIIPKKNGTEIPCWEFVTKSSETGEDALIYVNAKTGKEEDIMLLLYSDNGTLTK